MEYVPNVCLCLLWLLIDTVAMTGSKNITVNPDLTMIHDDPDLTMIHDDPDLTMIHDDPDLPGGDPCRLSNSTLLNVIITFNSTIQTGGGGRLLASPSGSGRLLENQNESNCINRLGVGGGGRLSIRWDWEEQRKTGTQMENNERCRINIQLDLKWSNNGTTEVESGGGLGLVVMDATLILEMSSLAPLQTPDDLVLPSRAKVLSNGDLGVIQKVYKCTNIRQVTAESEEVYNHQVATDADCGSNDWRQIQVQLLTENRSEENNSTSGPIPWNNYEMTCDLTQTQTTNAVENDRKMSPLSPNHQPNNPSTIYVATAFAILVLCIVVVYFVVKNRRQRASSYAAMNDD